MPDTYTSQFSGEEIDAALRAAHIISGASTPAELRDKLEIRGDTIPVSAGDSTLISEALTKIPTTSGGGVNPNLLDNWYFGRPVNQRNGYYIPAGVKYNTLSWTEAGTTDKAYPVIGYSGQDPLFTVNGTNYIVGKSAQVPGYCTTGYTVDRWKFTTDGGNVAISNGYLDIYSPKQYGSYLEQKIDPELAKALAGKTVTFSVLAADGDTAFSVNMNKNGSYVDSFTIKPNTVSYKTWTFPTDSTDILFNFAGNAAGHVRPIAIKLELGDTQTLAHKENGVWVLNEIPDFGEQLRRCQRYFVRLINAYGYGWTYSSSVANFLVPLPTTLRANPVVKLTKNGEIQTINGSKAVTGFEAKGIHPNGLAIDLHNSANALISGTPVTWHDSSMDISADL